jgi:hypothetical protein
VIEVFKFEGWTLTKVSTDHFMKDTDQQKPFPQERVFEKEYDLDEEDTGRGFHTNKNPFPQERGF